MRADAMATIRDVARASSVSIATVSRVLNGSPLVSDSTRKRVVAAADKLGYWPNAIARSLITNRTHAVGVLLPDLHGEFFSEVIHGIDMGLRERGFHLLVSRSSSNATDLTGALRAMRGRVDGLILMAPDLDITTALAEIDGRTRTVLVDPEAAVPGYDTISIANFAGACAVVQHLVGLGHREIATICGPDHNIDARERLEGYRAGLGEAGLAPLAGYEFGGVFTEHSGYDAAIRLLKSGLRPSAIVVANDYMAVGVLGALQDSHVRVPEDIAVTGFDDIPLARYLTPPLTTVHVDMQRLGRRAVQLLLDPDKLAKPSKPAHHEVLPTTLVVRGSCGANPLNPRGSRGAADPDGAAAPALD